MISFALTGNGMQEITAKPEIFVSEDDLKKLLGDKELQLLLHKTRGFTIIGCLGTQVASNEFEEIYKEVEAPRDKIEEICFYEKLTV